MATLSVICASVQRPDWQRRRQCGGSRTTFHFESIIYTVLTLNNTTALPSQRTAVVGAGI
eukprot:6213120-Pleurochrysis_carterae.AAC.3